MQRLRELQIGTAVGHMSPNRAINATSIVVNRVVPGGGAKCKACGKPLASDSVKVGCIHSHRDGFVLVQWSHLDCIKCPPSLCIDDIAGTERLCKEDVKRVCAWTRTVAAPA